MTRAKRWGKTIRKILYLDQLFISNLVRVDVDSDWEDDLRPFYEELLGLLRDLVNKNLIVCPTSPFHDDESDPGPPIVRKGAWAIAEELSDGLRFRNWTDIFFDQVIAAARAYCGGANSSSADWRMAFETDPQIPRTDTERQGVRVHFGSGDELVGWRQQSKSTIKDQYTKAKEEWGSRGLALDDLVVEIKRNIFTEGFFGSTMVNTGDSELSRTLDVLGYQGVMVAKRELDSVFGDCQNPAGFLESAEFLKCYVIDIRACLMAVDISHFPQLQPERSLNTDFDIVASVLPYADMFATDRHMADLIERCSLSERYNCAVITTRRRDELLRSLYDLE